MLSKNHKPKNGFTIIEIMIVLAIAGLIMLIVFLAVPALQRSGRNTQRRSDVGQISTAVSNYISNNGGLLPGFSATDTNATSVDICAANPCSGGNFEVAKLGYYSPGMVSVTGSAPNNWPDTNHVVILTGFTCGANGTTVGTASSRAVAILYALEGSNAAGDSECLEA